MNGQKRKAGLASRGRTHRTWRDEIVGDVFELWIGISRLMAKVREPVRARAPDARKRPPVKRAAARRRLARRKAA